MVLRVGEYEVQHTGTVISFEDEPITFEIADDYIIRMVFKNDSNHSETKMEFQFINDNRADILLINFNNPLGAGNIKPIQIGHTGGKNMYLNFRIYTLEGTSSKLVHYTWYARELITTVA